MRLEKILLRFFFTLCLLGTLQVSFAQKYDLIIRDTESGLAGNHVNDIVQDSTGIIWIATTNGVSAFNGIEFHNYTVRSGLAENICTSIFCDDQNRIWVGHQNAGISCIDHDTVVTFNEETGLINNEVHDIIQTKDGKVWIATFGGVSIYDEESWKSLTIDNGLSFNNIQVLAQYADGSVWAGSYGAGINVIQKGRISHLHMGNGLVNNYVTSLLANGKNMLIGTLGGISNWNGEQFTADLNTKGLFSNQINDLTLDEDGHLWLATFNGAVRLTEGQRITLSEINGLPQNEVVDIFADVEGNIWMGTKAGLVRVLNLAFSHFESTDEVDIYPSCMFVAGDGHLWVGNEAGGVLKFDGEIFSKAFEDPDINDHQISAIAEDNSGNLWFGTMDFGGLFQWNGKQFYIYSDEFGLADNNINCLATDEDGLLFIGTPNGLSTFNGTDFEVVYLSDDFASNHVTALETIDNGSVIIGSKDGTVHIYNDGEVKPFKQFRSNSKITDICKTDEGFCISTLENGVWVIQGERVIHIDETNGLPNAGAHVVFVNGNRLFAGSGQSIVQIRISPDTVLTTSFSRLDGYVGGTQKSGAVALYNGAHFIGTEKGITRFEPAEIRSNNHQPITQITELQLSYEKVDWGKMGFESVGNLPTDLELAHTDNNLRFLFHGINHQSPESVRYKWKLEGYEKEWTPASAQDQANYPNLPPGNYTFKIISCNQNGICNNQATEFSFRIIPPIWQRLSFHISVAIFIVLLTILFIKRRERILLKEKEILESTVQERTRELREQKEIVERQNEHITESIEYASNIQRAILPSESEMKRAFAEHFVFYRPKDTVGGDFYWVFSKGDISWAAAVDCTGHGVAGAFMSMIGSDLLNQIIIEKQVDDPATVLDEMDKGIKLAFSQSAEEFESDQGMDMALVRIDRKQNIVDFAGAQRPLFVVSDGELTEVDGNRFSISCAIQRNAEPFTKHSFKATKGTMLYLFSDGIVDQFGGPKGKKYMVRRLREFLTANAGQEIQKQSHLLTSTFDDWKGSEHDQIDDVMLLAIQL